MTEIDDSFLNDESQASEEDQKRRQERVAQIEKTLADRKKGIFKGLQLPLTYEQFQSLTYSDRLYLWDWETEWLEHEFFNTGVSPTLEDMISATFGEGVCPGCNNTKNRTHLRYGSKTGYREFTTVPCLCAVGYTVQENMNHLVGAEYRRFDLRTVHPSKACFRSLEQQAAEFQFLKEHRKDNFIFCGPAGTGKTTNAVLLAREAFWRHSDILKQDWYLYRPVANRLKWVWKCDAEKLFTQNMLWKTSMTSDTPAPEPDVTTAKIQKVVSRGLLPTVIIEELDKTKLTEPRVNFLFEIFNAVDEAKGQIVLTTNRTVERFTALFTESDIETVRVTGEPLVRRLLKRCHVRNYFND